MARRSQIQFFDSMRLNERHREAKALSLDDSSRSGWGRSLPVPATSPGRRPARTGTGDENDSPAAYWPGRRLRPEAQSVRSEVADPVWGPPTGAPRYTDA